MRESIFIVSAVTDDNLEVLRAYRNRATAIAFASECITHQRRRPLAIDSEAPLRTLKADHPCAPPGFDADYVEVSEIDFY